jgi:hypothetical protein
MIKKSKSNKDTGEQVLQALSEPPNPAIDKISIDKTQLKNYYTFKKKDQATEFMDSVGFDSGYRLFCEDIAPNKAYKRFICAKYHTIYNMSKNRQNHFYENHRRGRKVKLVLDLDQKYSDGEKKGDFNSLIGDCIDIVNESLEKYTKVKPEIIIIDGSRPGKNSAHIIYKNIIFEDIYHMKFFIMGIKNDSLIRNKIIDPNIYKDGCVRLLWNSKYGMSSPLEFHKDMNEDCEYSYRYTNNKTLFYDCLLLNIPKKHELIKIKLPTNLKVDSRLRTSTGASSINNIGVEQIMVSTLSNFINLLSKERADDYNDWIKVGMILYNCNQNVNSFELWNEWSKQSDSYDGIGVSTYKWNSFKFGSLGFGTLRHLAKEDSPDNYTIISCIEDKLWFETKKFNKEFLLPENKKIKGQNTVATNTIEKWLKPDSPYKTLAVRSPYNTGKTTMIKSLMNEFKFKKVLFVTHRQSLTNELHGSFKTYKFKNYMNKMYDADRFICQIESLHKIHTNNDSIYTNYAFDILADDVDADADDDPLSYDLVILDEIESILNHFDSTTIVDKDKTFLTLQSIVHNSTKVLALDGDFGNRSYEYIKEFGENLILENTIKKDKSHYVFTNSLDNFEADMFKAIKEGKNVVIISMSSNIAIKYDKQLRDLDIKCVLHCSKTGDQNKNMLKNVVKFWSKYQVVIYSPSVDSGIDFSLKIPFSEDNEECNEEMKNYFDKKYVILSNKSCSPRGLSQMMMRVRQVNDNNIMVFTNGLPYKIKAYFYKYNDIRDYVHEIYHKYFKPKFHINKKTNKYELKYEHNLYSRILIHNELEKKNKTSNYFIPMFIKLLTEKGCTYNGDDVMTKEERDVLIENSDGNDDKKKVHVTKINHTMEGVLNAKNISKKTYNLYILKQNENKATEHMKYAIEKYLYKKIWFGGIVSSKLQEKEKQVDEAFLKKYYRKTDTLYNLRYLMNKKNLMPYLSQEVCEEYKQLFFDKAITIEQIDAIKDLIPRLGFDLDKLVSMETESLCSKDESVRILIDNDTMTNNMNDCSKKCSLFVNVSKGRPLFEKTKLPTFIKSKKQFIFGSLKAFLGYINSILSLFGLCICVSSITKSIKINNKWKSAKINSYYLNFKDGINYYL